jgi:hypothetical protein
VIFGIRQF